jgi:hypothetical protein
MLLNAPNVGQPQAQDTSSKVDDVTETAKQHLTNEEFQELKEILAEYEDIFAVDSEDDVLNNKVSHGIDTEDARSIRQPPRRLPLALQAEVIQILADVQRRGIIEESNIS